jgi:hypothetical protein
MNVSHQDPLPKVGGCESAAQTDPTEVRTMGSAVRRGGIAAVKAAMTGAFGKSAVTTPKIATAAARKAWCPVGGGDDAVATSGGVDDADAGS